MTQANPDPDARRPDTVATAEGDAEFDPAAPLAPNAVEASLAGLQTALGAAPSPHDSDAPTGLERVIDEISHGTLLP